MSDFEKKTLSYAFCWTWFSTLFLYLTFSHFCDDANEDIHFVIIWGGLLVVCILNTVFGLWKICFTGGGYFREDNLTEREKFLSYKATSKTLPVFIAVLVVAWSAWACYLAATGKKANLAINPLDIAITFMTAFVGFSALKSYVLFAFLRKERRANKRMDIE